jgi:hypothetical protein
MYDYGTYIIGHEIMFRANQNSHKTDHLRNAQAIKDEYFNVPEIYEDCIPEPPCPFPKRSNDLGKEHILPFVMREAVAAWIEQGGKVWGFNLVQGELVEYYPTCELVPGPAKWVIEYNGVVYCYDFVFVR